jgi:hypothetical protein
VKEVKRKVFVIALAVVMLALPIASALATKPTTVITATLTMSGNPLDYVENRYLGKTGGWIATFTDAPFTITGDIIGDGVYDGMWLMKPIDVFPFGELSASNGWYIMDVEVNGASGTLTIRLPGNGKLIIVDGTGELENLRGTATMEMIDMLNYLLTFNVHWDP